jgi:hypothetical protein
MSRALAFDAKQADFDRLEAGVQDEREGRAHAALDAAAFIYR